jgi:hypothetical protein
VTPLELGFLSVITLWFILDPSLHHDMTSRQVSAFFAVTLTGIFTIGGVVGYARNLLTVMHSDFNHIDGELVVRVIGVPVIPIGAIAGWVQ